MAIREKAVRVETSPGNHRQVIDGGNRADYEKNLELWPAEYAQWFDNIQR